MLLEFNRLDGGMARIEPWAVATVMHERYRAPGTTTADFACTVVTMFSGQQIPLQEKAADVAAKIKSSRETELVTALRAMSKLQRSMDRVLERADGPLEGGIPFSFKAE